MCSRDWFIVGTRVFGLWVFYHGLWNTMVVVEFLLPIEQPDRGTFAPGTYLFHATWQLCFAWLLIFKTRSLAWLVGYTNDNAVGSSPLGTALFAQPIIDTQHAE